MTTTDWIQAISTLVLVAVTGIYAWRTHVISKATEKQAEASVEAVEEMRQHRYDTVRPVIDIQKEETPDARLLEGFAAVRGDTSHGLSCILHNIGLGPAIDVYSFIISDSGQKRRFDFGTLARDGKTFMAKNLSLEQEDNREALVVYYKDVYGRDIESRREVSTINAGGFHLGPLQVRLVKEVKTCD